MISYKSRAGRAIRQFLGGVIGAGLTFLLIVRAEAGEEQTAPRATTTPLAREAETDK